MTTEYESGGRNATNDLTTSSGIKLNFTAKGLLQPEITVRYATPQEAVKTASRDAFMIYEFIRLEAEARGIKLVTQDSGKEAR